MKVLVIHGSMRKNGNTGILADEFIRGAQEAGHETGKVELRDKTFGDCYGCRACHNTHLVGTGAAHHGYLRGKL